MSELAVTLLRLGYLVLLWVFVLSAIGVLRRDLYGTRIVPRRRPGRSTAPAGSEPRPAPAPQQDRGPTRLVVT
jgi:hypothetical protein